MAQTLHKHNEKPSFDSTTLMVKLGRNFITCIILVSSYSGKEYQTLPNLARDSPSVISGLIYMYFSTRDGKTKYSTSKC